MREAEVMARDHWTRDELLAYQEKRVQALITHAVTRSPYYNEVLGEDAPERPFTELPTLPKTTLMAEFDRVVTDPRLRLASLRAHLGSPDPSQSFLGGYRVATTSGTTGRRSIIAFTLDEAAAWGAVSARPMMRMGIGLAARFAGLGSPSPVHVTKQVMIPPGLPVLPMSGYAATEAPMIATSGPDHPELASAEDVVVSEIVDEDNRAAHPDSPVPRCCSPT
jgi:hypothetical protein